MAFSDTALGPFTTGAAKRLVAVSRFSKQLVAVSGSLCDKMLFAYKVSSSQALPLLHSPIVYFTTRDPQALVAPLALSGPQKPFLRPDVHTRGDFVFVCRPFRPISCWRSRLLLRNSLSLWMCGRLCNLRGAVKRMKPDQPQQLDHHQHSHITCTFSDCGDF